LSTSPLAATVAFLALVANVGLFRVTGDACSTLAFLAKGCMWAGPLEEAAAAGAQGEATESFSAAASASFLAFSDVEADGPDRVDEDFGWVAEGALAVAEHFAGLVGFLVAVVDPNKCKKHEIVGKSDHA
jgi:hypothetical protein